MAHDHKHRKHTCGCQLTRALFTRCRAISSGALDFLTITSKGHFCFSIAAKTQLAQASSRRLTCVAERSQRSRGLFVQWCWGVRRLRQRKTPPRIPGPHVFAFCPTVTIHPRRPFIQIGWPIDVEHVQHETGQRGLAPESVVAELLCVQFPAS